MKLLAIFIVDSFGCSTLTNMIGKYFLLAFVCVSLGQQVLGDDVENAIVKGLVKANSLYERGTRRIENAVNYHDEIIESKAERYLSTMDRVQETSEKTVSRAARTAEEKAKEADKPVSVFKCIQKAEKHTLTQIEISVKKFVPVLEKLEKVYLKKLAMAATPLGELKTGLTAKYEQTRTQIKSCNSERNVEITVGNFEAYVCRVIESAGNVQNQVNGILRGFDREARSILSATHRQISATQSVGLRQIRSCVYRTNQ